MFETLLGTRSSFDNTSKMGPLFSDAFTLKSLKKESIGGL